MAEDVEGGAMKRPPKEDNVCDRRDRRKAKKDRRESA